VTTQLTLVAYCAGYLAVLTALGSGPALSLTRSLLPTPPLLLAPCIGVALAGAGLVSVWPWMTMETATWAVLVPACIISLAWAGLTLRRDGFGDPRELAIPGGIMGLGVAIAILPALLRETLGPTTLLVYDAWGYIPIDEWMRTTHEGTRVTPFTERWDVAGVHGWDATQHGARVGVSAINATVSTLFGTSPDNTHLAFTAVLFGLVPVSVWIVARAIGLGRVGATFGAAFGLSPAIYSMVADSTVANLTASVLIAPLLLIGGLAAARGGFGACATAGVLIGGIISIYPEYLTPTLGVAAIAAIALIVVRIRERSFTRAWLRPLVARFAITTAAIIVVWWVPLHRAEVYLSQLTSPNQPAFAGLPPRWLTLSDIGAWAFGVLHVYQLQRFAVLSTSRQGLAIVLPILLGLLVLWGSTRLGLWRAILLLAPVAVAIPLALEAQDRYQGGNCEYCAWKALTYTLPFLAIGVAAGSDRIWRVIRDRRDRWRLVAIVAGVVPLAGVATLAYANERLGTATYESKAALSTDLRAVADHVARLPPPRRVLIDAPDSDNASPFQLPATYFLLRETPDTFISFDAAGVAPSYLHPFHLPVPRFYSPTYQYVLTPFAGMATGRHVLEQRGNFALERRRPVDVTIARTGWTLDTQQGAAAIPWIQAPFLIWVASPQPQKVGLRISLDRPLQDDATLTFARAGHPLRVVRSAGGAELCVPLDVPAGGTSLLVSPQFDAQPPPISRATESDPLPSPSRALGVAGLRADTRACPPAQPGTDLPSLAFGTGWFAPEIDPTGAGNFRWMGTTAKIDVGFFGTKHPAAVLRSTVSSLAVRRRVTVTINGKLVQTVEAITGDTRPLVIRIPAGTGVAHVVLHADPPASSATAVNPADTRMLAVRVRVPTVARS
jgi:hypothetical protein